MNAENSISKSIRILKALAEGTERIADICNQLNLSKGTVHRLLKTLETNGFVIQEPTTRGYHLAPLFVDLASRPIAAHNWLIVSALGGMNRLRSLTKETVVLHVRIGLERICISEVESKEEIKYTAGVGSMAPIYVGSAGKMLLAELEEKQLVVIMNHLVLQQVGPNTITDKLLLLEELATVRKQGHAVSEGERIREATGISVPIKNYICPVALSVLGPKDRFGPVKMSILPEMIETGHTISKNLIGQGN